LRFRLHYLPTAPDDSLLNGLTEILKTRGASFEQLAQAEGKLYQPKALFIDAPEVMEYVFSSTEVARELSRA
jgi:hypothetical protein